jgi:hypothetical protein
MAGKREERERLRQERLAAQRSSGSNERVRMIAGYAVAGLLTVAVLVGLGIVLFGGDDGGDGNDVPEGCDNANIQAEIGVTKDYECDNREGTPPPELQFGDLDESITQAKCEANLDLPDEGNTHFTDETQGSYDTNPPTSGDHLGVPNEAGSGAVADGAYLTTPPESRLVHSMEHGRVEIRYNPDLPEDQQLALKGVFDEDSGGMIMVPDPDLPFEVAFSAWTNFVGCPSYDPLTLDVLRNFRDTYRGNAPENFPVDL